MINLKTGKQFNAPPCESLPRTATEESAGHILTRREFGKGLAAIIGAGVAPSIALGTVSLAGSANTSVGGMMRNVGARNAAMFGGRKHRYIAIANGSNSCIWSGFSYPAAGNLRVVTTFRFTAGYNSKQYQCLIGNSGLGIIRFDPASIHQYGRELWFGAGSGNAFQYDLSELKYHTIDYYLDIDNQYASYSIDGDVLFAGYRSLSRNSSQNQLLIMCRSVNNSINGLWYATFAHLESIDIYKNGSIEKQFRPDVSVGIAGLREMLSGSFFTPSVGSMIVGEEYF